MKFKNLSSLRLFFQIISNLNTNSANTDTLNAINFRIYIYLYKNRVESLMSIISHFIIALSFFFSFDGFNVVSAAFPHLNPWSEVLHLFS